MIMTWEGVGPTQLGYVVVLLLIEGQVGLQLLRRQDVTQLHQSQDKAAVGAKGMEIRQQ